MSKTINDLGVNLSLNAAESTATARRLIKKLTKGRLLSVRITFRFNQPVSRTVARRKLWLLLRGIDAHFGEVIFRRGGLHLWAIGLFRNEQDQIACDIAIHLASVTAPTDHDIQKINEVAQSFWADICAGGKLQCSALGEPVKFIDRLRGELRYRSRLADVVVSTALDQQFA